MSTEPNTPETPNDISVTLTDEDYDLTDVEIVEEKEGVGD